MDNLGWAQLGVSSAGHGWADSSICSELPGQLTDLASQSLFTWWQKGSRNPREDKPQCTRSLQVPFCATFANAAWSSASHMADLRVTLGNHSKLSSKGAWIHEAEELRPFLQSTTITILLFQSFFLPLSLLLLLQKALSWALTGHLEASKGGWEEVVKTCYQES